MSINLLNSIIHLSRSIWLEPFSFSKPPPLFSPIFFRGPSGSPPSLFPHFFRGPSGSPSLPSHADLDASPGAATAGDMARETSEIPRPTHLASPGESLWECGFV